MEIRMVGVGRAEDMVRKLECIRQEDDDEEVLL